MTREIPPTSFQVIALTKRKFLASVIAVVTVVPFSVLAYLLLPPGMLRVVGAWTVGLVVVYQLVRVVTHYLELRLDAKEHRRARSL